MFSSELKGSLASWPVALRDTQVRKCFLNNYVPGTGLGGIGPHPGGEEKNLRLRGSWAPDTVRKGWEDCMLLELLLHGDPELSFILTASPMAVRGS